MHARYSLPVAVLVVLAASASAFAPGTGRGPSSDFARAAPGTSLRSAARCVPSADCARVRRGGRGASRPACPGVHHLLVHREPDARRRCATNWTLTATRLEALTGESWSLSGRDRGVALVVGGKYMFGSGAFRPLCGRGGGGVINLKRTVFETRIGDVTRAVYHDFNLGDAELSVTPEGVNKPPGRVRVWRRHRSPAVGTSILGYRYRNAYRTPSPR